ncbi:hypothetical protein FQA39_LY15838 [Lamprigera yunnana]|nr:hypothetical protein FQA39_LY15838 [Lamprigera yunnana]
METAEEKAQQFHMQEKLDWELLRLDRQQRFLSEECEALRAGKVLVKQKNLLGILKKENCNVLRAYSVATGGPNKLVDYRLNSELVELLETHDQLNDEIKHKRLMEKDLDEAIVMHKKMVVHAKTKVTTDFQQQDKILKCQQTLAQLENKLDTYIKQWCSVNGENRQLRYQINHYVLEREVFNKLWYGGIKRLNRGKQIMMDLIEQSTLAYDFRDQIVTLLNTLRERCHSHLIQNTEEMIALERKKDHEEKLYNFMDVKGEKRLLNDLLNLRLKKQKKKREELRQTLEKYMAILNSVEEFGGTSSLQDFITTYKQIETENLSIFNYISTIKAAICNYTQIVIDHHTKIDEQVKLRDTRELLQKQKLEDLQFKLEHITKECEEIDSRNARLEGTLQQMYGGIMKVFTTCKCSTVPFLTLLGNNTSVNEYNVLIFLKLIEEQIDQLLLRVCHSEVSQKVKGAPSAIRKDIRVYPVNAIKNIVLTTPCPLCVEKEQVTDIVDVLQLAHDKVVARKELNMKLKVSNALERLHNVSACNLPKSRQIIQRRYQ